MIGSVVRLVGLLGLYEVVLERDVDVLLKRRGGSTFWQPKSRIVVVMAPPEVARLRAWVAAR